MIDLSLFFFFFKIHGFRFQDFTCNGCHDLSVNISDIAIITIKNIDCRCIIHNISRSEAINLFLKCVLEDRRYI